MTSLLPLNNFCPMMSHRRIIARLIIVYGSVTRYGPRKLPAREINAE